MEISQPRTAAAECLRIAADKLSEFRIHYADVVVETIQEDEDFQSWELVRHVGVACLTDVVDGVLGRFSAKLTGESTTEENSRTDGDADKLFHRNTLGALAFAAYRDGYEKYGRSLTESLVINISRDERVDERRNEVAEMNTFLDDEHKLSASANGWGQIKTWVNSFGLGVAVSPWARRKPGRLIASGLYRLGARLSLKSEAGINDSIDAQVSALELTNEIDGI